MSVFSPKTKVTRFAKFGVAVRSLIRLTLIKFRQKHTTHSHSHAYSGTHMRTHTSERCCVVFRLNAVAVDAVVFTVATAAAAASVAATAGTAVALAVLVCVRIEHRNFG